MFNYHLNIDSTSPTDLRGKSLKDFLLRKESSMYRYQKKTIAMIFSTLYVYVHNWKITKPNIKVLDFLMFLLTFKVM